MALCLTACGKDSSPEQKETEKPAETAVTETAEPEEVIEEAGYYVYTCGMLTSRDDEVKAFDAYFNAVSEATDGHVQISPVYAAMLFPASESADAVANGAIPAGQVPSNSLSAPLLSIAEVVTLPLQGFDDNVKATQVLWDLYEENESVAWGWDSDYQVLQLFVYPSLIRKTAELPQSVEKTDGRGLVYGICFNREAWDALPEEYRETIDSVSGREASVKTAEV